MVKRRITCSTSANRSLMSRHGVISDLLVGDCWTYRTSQTLWRGTRNELRNFHRRRHLYGWAAVMLGIGPHF